MVVARVGRLNQVDVTMGERTVSLLLGVWGEGRDILGGTTGNNARNLGLGRRQALGWLSSVEELRIVAEVTSVWV